MQNSGVNASVTTKEESQETDEDNEGHKRHALRENEDPD